MGIKSPETFFPLIREDITRHHNRYTRRCNGEKYTDIAKEEGCSSATVTSSYWKVKVLSDNYCDGGYLSFKDYQLIRTLRIASSELASIYCDRVEDLIIYVNKNYYEHDGKVYSTDRRYKDPRIPSIRKIVRACKMFNVKIPIANKKQLSEIAADLKVSEERKKASILKAILFLQDNGYSVNPDKEGKP